jgi:hypothetical protein
MYLGIPTASSPSTPHPEKQVFDAMNDDNASSGSLFKVERVALGPREIQDQDLAVKADHNLERSPFLRFPALVLTTLGNCKSRLDLRAMSIPALPSAYPGA